MSLSRWAVRVETANQETGLCTILVEEKGACGRTFRSKVSNIRGNFVGPFQRRDHWEVINRGITWRPTDIVISTYPKCGTTWIEQVILLLLNGGRVESLDPLHKNAVNAAIREGVAINMAEGKVWPEACLCETIREAESDHLRKGEFAPMTFAEFGQLREPRVVKTHAPWHMFPGLCAASLLPQGLKVVHVTRNPMDAAVSGFYHAFNPHKCGWPFDAWLKLWVEGLVPSGSFFDYEQGWLAAARCFPDQVLIIHYEDVKTSPSEQVMRVAKHLGITVDQEVIKRVIRGSSFDHMKDAINAKATAIEASGGKVWGAFGHMRKGAVGDWRNHFDEKLSLEFYDLFQMRMAGAGVVYNLGEGKKLQA